jgi:hypothetical protein
MTTETKPVEATCRTCPFGREASSPKWHEYEYECRRKPPIAALADDWPPLVMGTYWCGDHPLRERDKLAATAMQGLVTGNASGASAEECAHESYRIADAMIAERRRRIIEDAS